MTITVSMGPIPLMQFTDVQGNFVAFGKLYTKSWDTRQPKPVFRDPGALNPWSNPITLDMAGRVFGEIFWETDTPYYLELYDRNGAKVWASNEPYVPANGGGTVVTNNLDITNLIINGQFRFFPIASYNPIPTSIPILANGGWSYVKDGVNTENSLDFNAYTLDNTTVSASPVYYLNYVSNQPGSGETVNDAVFTIPDVRTLENEIITLGINIRSAIAGSYPVVITFVQHFGTGGTPSADVVTTIATFTPTTTANNYTGSITVPVLTGKTLGTNGDDNVQIHITSPLNSIANLEYANLYLKRGSAAQAYPYVTSSETRAVIKALELPDYNSLTYFPTDTTTYPTENAYDAIMLLPMNGILSPAYLPTVPIGTGFLWFLETAPFGYVMGQGQAVLKAGQYNRLYSTTDGNNNQFGGRWGYPQNNVNNIPGTISSNQFQVVVETPAAVTPVNAGTTGFTVTRITVGHTQVVNSSLSGATFTITNLANGAFTPPVNANTSGISFTVISNGSAGSPASWSGTVPSPSTLTGGDYFSFQTPGGNYALYFIIDGVGSAPSVPGYTVNGVAFSATDIAADVAQLLVDAITGYEYSVVTTLPASSLVAGDYWQFGIVGQDYAMWYAINGSGTPPSLSGPILIRVDLLLTDTDVEVAQKSFYAINPLLWYLPDTRGYFPRFWDDGAGVDPDAATRTALNSGGVTGDHPGTYEQDEIKSHTHELIQRGDLTGGGGTFAANNAGGSNYQSGATGGTETRPKNFYFSLIIKY